MALFLDRSILDLLGITSKTPLRLTTDGHNLLITPVSDEDQNIIMTSAHKMAKRYQKVFKKLAE